MILRYHAQNGVMNSIKPQQITYIVPGVENFDHTDISDFIQKAHNNLVSSHGTTNTSISVSRSFLVLTEKHSVSLLTQDTTLLEFAWVELLESNKSVTAEELAEVYPLSLTDYVLYVL